MGISQILFILVTAIATWFAYKNYSRVRRNILLGKDYKVEGDKATRWKNVFLIAFGQKKMFKRWIPAIFHLFIYVAFLFTQIELVEILMDGLLGTHRVLAPYLGGLYPAIIGSVEILSFLALIATFVFLARRNLLKIPRFVKPEMNGWPKLDANLILLGELILVTGIFMMNGADVSLQNLLPNEYHHTGFFPVSSFLGHQFFSGFDVSTLKIIERTGWWLHFLVVLGFINYLPFSKHLHIFLAFPNVYFAKTRPRGEMENMPEIMKEVKSMLGLIPEEELEMTEELPDFGAHDVTELTWKNILDSYTCTECGRCTSVCPANITGKKLSPRKIVMNVRDRAEEIGKNIESGDLQFLTETAKSQNEKLSVSNYNDGKSLFDYISREEIHACTTCNACVEACPVLIDPLDIILQLRRYEILTESAGPPDWMPMFTSLENSGSVWQVPDARDHWRQEN